MITISQPPTVPESSTSKNASIITGGMVANTDPDIPASDPEDSDGSVEKIVNLTDGVVPFNVFGHLSEDEESPPTSSNLKNGSSPLIGKSKEDAKIREREISLGKLQGHGQTTNSGGDNRGKATEPQSQKRGSSKIPEAVIHLREEKVGNVQLPISHNTFMNTLLRLPYSTISSSLYTRSEYLAAHNNRSHPSDDSIN